MGIFDWFRRKPATGKDSLQVPTIRESRIVEPALFDEPAAPVAPVEAVKDKAMSPATPQRRLVTKEQIAAGMGIPVARADIYDDWLNETMVLYRINTRNRIAAFLAQIAVESGGLRWVKEIYGPTPAQRRYEGRKDLGNIYKGDGKRFIGHGLIQITGRHNHRKVTQWIRRVVPDAPDFEANPEMLTLPRWAALSAGAFWDWSNLNELADKQAITAVSKRVNGGYNGLAERKKYWARFLNILK
jgi:putative chitinase